MSRVPGVYPTSSIRCEFTSGGVRRIVQSAAECELGSQQSHASKWLRRLVCQSGLPCACQEGLEALSFMQNADSQVDSAISD